MTSTIIHGDCLLNINLDSKAEAGVEKQFALHFHLILVHAVYTKRAS